MIPHSSQFTDHKIPESYLFFTENIKGSLLPDFAISKQESILNR